MPLTMFPGFDFVPKLRDAVESANSAPEAASTTREIHMDTLPPIVPPDSPDDMPNRV